MPHAADVDWARFLAAMALALVRISGMVAFAPFFSSTALPVRTKAVFVGAVAVEDVEPDHGRRADAAGGDDSHANASGADASGEGSSADDEPSNGGTR
jgi:hypothetical protein